MKPLDESVARLVDQMRAASSAKKQAPRFTPVFWNAMAMGLSSLILVVGIHSVRNRHPFEEGPSVAGMLAHASASEHRPVASAQPGVIVQRVRVWGGGNQVDWLVYHDRQGKRTPKFRPASSKDSKIQRRLEMAGVTREDPLSVASFRIWRNQLPYHSDSVVRSGSGLIAIKTSTENKEASLISEETLNIREADYHVVSRTVTFRDAGTIEIAELDYRVVGWNEAKKDWFSSDVERPSLPSIALRPVPVFTKPLPDPAQLELSELRARLILSDLGADTSDQVSIDRSVDGIRVKGMVYTAQRKLDLQNALAAIPYVTLAVATPEERDQTENTISSPAHITVVDSTSRPSPLLAFLKTHPDDSYGNLSAQMIDAGIRISQQAHALAEIQSEFGSRLQEGSETQQAYEELVRSHLTKLDSALKDQGSLLERLLPHGESAEKSTALQANGELGDFAARSLQLSRELVSGTEDEQRDAGTILRDLAADHAALSASAANLLPTQR